VCRMNALTLVTAATAQSPGSPRVLSAAPKFSVVYDWWCARPGSGGGPLCRRHFITAKLANASTSAERSSLIKQAQSIPRSTCMQELDVARASFCSRSEGRTQKLCTERGGPRASSSSHTTGQRSEIFDWLCPQPDLSEEQRDLCSRNVVAKQLIAANTTQSKKLVQNQLEAMPFSSAAFQAVVAEYCTIANNMDLEVCTTLQSTRERLDLAKTTCSDAEHWASTLYCRQANLTEQLRVLPPDAENREPLLKELHDLAKTGKEKGKIAEQASTAVDRFCMLPEKVAYALCEDTTCFSFSY